MNKDTLPRPQEPVSGNFWDMVLASAEGAFRGRRVHKANAFSVRADTSEPWCWLLLYTKTSARKIGVLARFTTPTGQAAWEAVQAGVADGRVILPDGARCSSRDDRGLPRWNIVLTRDLPADGSLPEAAEVEWMIEQAQALDRAITPLISGHPA